VISPAEFRLIRLVVGFVGSTVTAAGCTVTGVTTDTGVGLTVMTGGAGTAGATVTFTTGAGGAGGCSTVILIGCGGACSNRTANVSDLPAAPESPGVPTGFGASGAVFGSGLTSFPAAVEVWPGAE
jgi:hypothetical protein